MARSKWGGNGEYYTQPTTADLKDKAKASAKASSKRGKSLDPIIIEGTKIAKTWWGIEWCNNLERYADYSSRIGRGKRYVRSGTVIDLEIDRNTINAKVQGSRKTPYKVEIHIDPLPEKTYIDIIKVCNRRIENLEALVEGAFPAELKEFFIKTRGGLFPNPKEIHFNCSCPDWAYMCKHVAAVLYGIGNRLDSDPLLFFAMRNIDMTNLIQKSVDDKIASMLENSDTISSRVIEDHKLVDLFGNL